jgi:hypothetical protein
MTSQTAALGDADLKEDIKKRCTSTEGLEAWIAGCSHEMNARDERTEEELREEYNSMDSQFLKVNCRIMELYRDTA